MTACQVAPDRFVESMQQEMQQYLQSVMQAVNNAPHSLLKEPPEPDGQWKNLKKSALA